MLQLYAILMTSGLCQSYKESNIKTYKGRNLKQCTLLSELYILHTIIELLHNVKPFTAAIYMQIQLKVPYAKT